MRSSGFALREGEGPMARLPLSHLSPSLRLFGSFSFCSLCSSSNAHTTTAWISHMWGRGAAFCFFFKFYMLQHIYGMGARECLKYLTTHSSAVPARREVEEISLVSSDSFSALLTMWAIALNRLCDASSSGLDAHSAKRAPWVAVRVRFFFLTDYPFF